MVEMLKCDKVCFVKKQFQVYKNQLPTAEGTMRLKKDSDKCRTAKSDLLGT
jgi:hypothetical protein